MSYRPEEYALNRALYAARARRSFMRTKYNLTVEQYDAMLAAQGGVCALCGQPERTLYRARVRRLSVDHPHEGTGVRALLCASCNRGIGLLGDDPNLLRKAADYLDAHAA